MEKWRLINSKARFNPIIFIQPRALYCPTEAILALTFISNIMTCPGMDGPNSLPGLNRKSIKADRARIMGRLFLLLQGRNWGEGAVGARPLLHFILWLRTCL